jgi:hypothetical protein
LTSINLERLSVERHIPMDNITELALSEDGRLAFALLGISEVSRIDLSDGTITGPVKVGRTSARVRNFFGQVAAAAAAGAVAGLAGAAFAPYSPYYPFGFYPYIPSPPTHQAHIAIGGEGEAYVLSTETRDITVLNARSTEVTAHLPVSGFQLLPVPDRAVVQDLKAIHVVNLAGERIAVPIEAGQNFTDVRVAPDGQLVCGTWPSWLSCVDFRTGKASRYSLKLDAPTAIAFPGL